jgi:hypothetical protein
MKKNIAALSFLILAMLACNMAAGTPVSAPELLPLSPTIQSVTVAPVTSTPIVLPTQTVQTPAFTPIAPAQPDLPNKIKFNPGGTWIDVSDSLAAGVSKTYHLNAMQGQIMSVSILAEDMPGAWGYFPLEIKGSNGTILCPVEVNTECNFWRGKLPSSQDYFITVKSGGDLTDFTLRVAINPPGKTEQLFQYKNPVTGFSLIYSDQFAPVRFPLSANNKTEINLALQFIDTNSYLNTNLSEVYFLPGSSSNPQTVAACTDPNPNGGAPEEAKGSQAINGYNFVHSQSVGAGAGNIYQQEIYRMADHGVCYEVIFFIHYSNIGNYPPGVVTEFDSSALMQKLDDILSTFTLK